MQSEWPIAAVRGATIEPRDSSQINPWILRARLSCARMMGYTSAPAWFGWVLACNAGKVADRRSLVCAAKCMRLSEMIFREGAAMIEPCAAVGLGPTLRGAIGRPDDASDPT